MTLNASRVWLAREIEAFARALPSNAVVLDAGAGRQNYRPLFAGMTYESADFERVEHKIYGSSTYVCDLDAIPADNDRYDDGPSEQREVWRMVFDHYVFCADGDPGEHLPEHARGILGLATPTLLKRMRMTIKKIAENI